jgi:ABC-type ATPase involved in cell division
VSLHLRRQRLLQALKCARVLIDAPIALPADEERTNIDRPAREDLKVAVTRTAAIGSLSSNSIPLGVGVSL